MNEYRYGAPAGEKPLDHLVTDGGYASIFRTIACVGDSLSSGEFETRDPVDGNPHYYDLYPHSWGQYMARMAGFTCYNFSRGGMTAQAYCDSCARDLGWWDAAKKAQGYIIALGVNDLIGARGPLGEMGDIHSDDPEQNGKTYTGYYARIIQTYKAMQPDAKFFLITPPRSVVYEPTPEHVAIFDSMAARIRELAAYFDNTYVIDLRTYAPVHDEAYAQRFYLYGHMNAMGYRLTAEQVLSYMDYIIRHNPADFVNLPFVGDTTPRLC